MKPTVVRGGSGLGDSLYVQSVARHLIEQGEKVEVCTFWPDVFLPLKGRVIVSDFRRGNVDRVAHYTPRKGIPGTDQWQDCCIQAGIREPAELRLDWTVRNTELVGWMREIARGRQIVAVQLPRNPMDRKDGFGKELLPDCNVIQRAIDLLKPHACIVQIGSGDPLYRFQGVDLDLANRTSVTDLIDVAASVDGFLGYVSFLVPLAESLNKPALLVWAARCKHSKREFIRRITPEKVLHRKETSLHVWDPAGDDELAERVAVFVKLIGAG